MMLSTSRTKTNNKNNAHFKLLICYIVFSRWKSDSLWLENIQGRPKKQSPIDVLKRAAGALRQSGKLRQSAREFKVSKTTLKRFVDQMSIDEERERERQNFYLA